MRVLYLYHPSGDPSPNRDDIEITKRIYEADRIIGDGTFVSFKEKNLF